MFINLNKKDKYQVKINKSDTKHSIFDNIIMDIFLFIATILSMIATAAIIHRTCRHTKLKALLMGIAFQPVKQRQYLVLERNNKTVLYNGIQ